MNREEELLTEEYRQVAENLRFGWRYIFDFFRYFVVIQIVLLGALAGFTGYKDNFNTENISTIAQSSEKPEKKQVTQLSVKKYPVIFYVSCFIGFLFSIGTVIFNLKLYKISTEYVGRADSIEKKLLSPCSEKNDGTLVSSIGHEHSSHYIFMNQRQYKVSGTLFNMKNISSIFYGAFALTWLIVLFWSACETI